MEAEAIGRRLRPATGIVLLALAALASISPILILENLPLVDAPNHLARLHILDAITRDADLARYYQVKDGFYPYYGFRIAGLLAPLLGAEQAGRLFAAMALLLPGFGAVALSWAIHRRFNVHSLAAFALSMNMMAGLGFLNFLFAAGALLFAFAAWISLAHWPLAKRVAVFCPMIFATGCLHLVAAGILLFLILAYELSAAGCRGRGLHLTGLAVARMGKLLLLVTPLLLLLMLVGSRELGYSESYFGFAFRLEALVSPFVLGLDETWRVPEFLLAMSLLALLYIALRSGLLRVRQPYGLLLAFMITAAAMVPVMVNGVYGLHLRLPLVIGLVLVATLEVDRSRAPARVSAALAVGAVLITMAHLLLSSFVLQQQDQRIAELREASQVVPRGARVLTATDVEGSRRPGAVTPKSLLQVASYLVIDRSVFLPTLFGMYEVGVREPYRHMFPLVAEPVSLDLLEAELRGQESLPEWARIGNYDVILLFNPDPRHSALPRTKIIATGSYFRLLEVSRVAR